MLLRKPAASCCAACSVRGTKAALATENIFIDAKYIELDEPIRQLDKYDVQIRFSPDIASTIHIWVLRSLDSDKARALEPDAYDAAETDDEGQDAEDRADEDRIDEDIE